MDIKETPLEGRDLRFDIFDARGNIETHTMHYHDCLELDYVYDGQGINSIDGQSYDMSTGDIYLINNFEHHFAIHQKELKMKVILFDPSLVWDRSDEEYDFIRAFYGRNKRLRLNETAESEFRAVLRRLETEYKEKKASYRLYIRALLAELLVILSRNAYSGEEQSGLDHAAYDKIRPAIEYIRSEPGGDMSLSKLSDICCMSANYFSAYFKKVMAVNVSEYVEAVRIGRAQELLLTTTMPVTEICYECGYKSISSFNTAFRKISGATPRAYRKQYDKS